MTARSTWLTGTILGALVLSGTAQAQTGSTQSNRTTQIAKANNHQIETVMVTAEMRRESIQTTPVTVTAVSASQISKMFVHNLADLDHVAPDFLIEGVGAIHRNAAVIYSRGVGYEGVDLGQDPAVAISVDGVFEPSNVGALSNMLDVANIQILQGPQGTLWGKNTIAGVINVTTKKPGSVFGIEGSARYGSYGRQDYFMAVNLPIDSTLAARIAFSSQYSDGPYKNAYQPPPGQPPVPRRLGGDNIKTVRGTLVWTPIPRLSFNLMASYTHDRSPSVGGQNGSVPTDVLTFFGYPGWDYRTPGLPYPLGPNKPFVVYRNFPSGDYEDDTFIALNTRYRARDFDIVSVTGYVRNWNYSYNDYDNTELNFFQSTFGLHSKQLSEELRLESNTQGPLKWVAGAMYSTRRWDGTQLFYSMFPSLNNHIDYSRQHDKSWAVFGQATYAITSKLNLTGGVRYTSEMKDIFRIPSHDRALPTPAPFYFSKTWTNATYHASLSYKINSTKMVYVSYSTGFVSGGFNTRVDTAFLTGQPYSPETVSAWEAGLRSDWFHNHLRANLTGFMNKYDNLQVGAFIPGGGLQQAIVNNAHEQADGLEAELTALPFGNLLLSANVGWLDASYTSFFADLSGTGVATNNAALVVPKSPKWTYRLGASYDFNLDGHGHLTPTIDYAYQSSVYAELTNSPVGYQSGFGLLNASVAYAPPGGNWTLSFYGKNLTNKLYRISAVPSSGYFTQLYFGNPRTYGVQLTFKLDRE